MATKTISSLPRQLPRANPIFSARQTPITAPCQAATRPLSSIARCRPIQRASSPAIISTSSYPTRSRTTRPLPTTQTRHQSTSNPDSKPTPTPNTNTQKTKIYDFSTIQSLTTHPSPDRILIDVREPSEFQPGHIPGAINLPLKSAPEALMLPADEFEERFGVEKPRREQEVVFYCQRGVRSAAAARLAEEAGWVTVGEYRGSWGDWVDKGGEVERG